MRRLTRLVTYGISVWRGEDGTLHTNEDPSDPEIMLTLPDDLSPEDVAAGTEVWLWRRATANPGGPAARAVVLVAGAERWGGD